MLSCVIEKVVPDDSKNCSATIFRILLELLDNKGEGITVLRNEWSCTSIPAV
jgi:hypothetical protein